MNQALQKVEPQELAIPRQEPSVAEMLKAVVERGVTTENVAAVGQLVSLYERMQTKEAEKSFARSFVALQKSLPTIVAKTVIPNRGKYERFEDVMSVVGPLLVENGFSVSFTNSFQDGRVVETCTLTHCDGHSRTNSFAVRVGRGDSDTQADCKAATTAKRNALLNALNIVIRQDCLTEEDDARLEGAPITKEQAEELERRVKLTNSDEAAFLKLAGAKTYAEILSGKYSMLDGLLARKERAGR